MGSVGKSSGSAGKLTGGVYIFPFRIALPRRQVLYSSANSRRVGSLDDCDFTK
jgi:hypothetical protein